MVKFLRERLKGFCKKAESILCFKNKETGVKEVHYGDYTLIEAMV